MSSEEKKTRKADWERGPAEEKTSSAAGRGSSWGSRLDDEDPDELDDLGMQVWEEFQDEEELTGFEDGPEENPPRMEEDVVGGNSDEGENSRDDGENPRVKIAGEEKQNPAEDASDEEIPESGDGADGDGDNSRDSQEIFELEDDLEDKISLAMEKIVQDAMGGSMDEDEEVEDTASHRGDSGKEEEREEAHSERRQNRRARPDQFAYVPVEDGEMPVPGRKSGKKHKGLRITGIVAAMLVVAAGCAYAGVSYYYADKFFEGTTINGIDCSGMTPYEVEQAIARQVENYSIEVDSRNLEPQRIDGSQINYRYLSSGDILKLLKHQRPWQWVLGYFQPVTYTAAENITFDRSMLQSEILALNCAKDENQVEPEDAYVTFKDTQFEIVPETEGSKLDLRSAYQLLDKAISDKQTAMDFTAEPEAYVQAAVTREDPDLKATVNACNNFTRTKITYVFGDETVILDGSTIKDWLQFDDKGQYVRNEASFKQHISEYVAQLAANYDTVGTEREFYTTSGRTVYVYGSAYGWKIDKEAEEAQLFQEIQSGAQVQREPIYSMTANARGRNDLGNTYIEVDLSDQHMYYYQNGQIIFDSPIVSGLMSDPTRQTPPGIFTLYSKSSPDVLRGQQKPDGTLEYETHVDYWMPFNGGIGFHDANWQPYFGGDRYLEGGSHGCINLPPSNAAVLYDIIQYGVPIVCFY